jgi:hypothetical protein
MSLFGDANKNLPSLPSSINWKVALEKRDIGNICIWLLVWLEDYINCIRYMSTKTEAGTLTLASRSWIIPVVTPTLDQMDSPSVTCKLVRETQTYER